MYMNFPNKLRTLREQRRINQTELAKALGVKPQSVQSWESGRTMPRTKRLKIIADYFDISLISLMEEQETPKIGQSSIDLAVRIDSLADSQKRWLLEKIEVFEQMLSLDNEALLELMFGEDKTGRREKIQDLMSEVTKAKAKSSTDKEKT